MTSAHFLLVGLHPDPDGVIDGTHPRSAVRAARGVPLLLRMQIGSGLQ